VAAFVASTAGYCVAMLAAGFFGATGPYGESGSKKPPSWPPGLSRPAKPGTPDRSSMQPMDAPRPAMVHVRMECIEGRQNAAGHRGVAIGNLAYGVFFAFGGRGGRRSQRRRCSRGLAGYRRRRAGRAFHRRCGGGPLANGGARAGYLASGAWRHGLARRPRRCGGGAQFCVARCRGRTPPTTTAARLSCSTTCFFQFSARFTERPTAHLAADGPGRLQLLSLRRGSPSARCHGRQVKQPAAAAIDALARKIALQRSRSGAVKLRPYALAVTRQLLSLANRVTKDGAR